MNKAFRFISHLLGFEKLSRYEKKYLHDANVRSSRYMAVIAILLESWMIIRQTHAKIIPKYEAGGDLLKLIITYTSKYWLFMLIGLAVLLFCIYQKDKRMSKVQYRSLIAASAACILYTAVLGTGILHAGQRVGHPGDGRHYECDARGGLCATVRDRHDHYCLCRPQIPEKQDG